MIKVALLLAFASFGANGSLLGPLLPTVSPLDLFNAAVAELAAFQTLVDDGVAVKPVGFDEAVNTTLIVLPGGLVLNAGLVALPAPFLCSQNDIIYRLNCRIGANDCTYVHNTYSGKCAISPNPVAGTSQEDGQVFVCNDQNPTGYNFVNLSDNNQCGPLLGAVLDPLLDLALQNALRTRFAADLCQGTLDSSGCNSDCRNNHQYSKGVCVDNAIPTAVFTGELSSQFQCVCSL